jgi:cytochrome c553
MRIRTIIVIEILLIAFCVMLSATLPRRSRNREQFSSPTMHHGATSSVASCKDCHKEPYKKQAK